MKKMLLAVLPLFMLSLTAFAQLEKGTILLGGGVGYSSSTSNSESSNAYNEYQNTNFSFSPDAGYFFKDTWVLGISLPFSGQTTKVNTDYASGAEDTNSESKTSSYGVAPFVRKYFPFGEKMAFYGQVKTGYFHQTTENIPNVNDDSSSTTRGSNQFNVVTTAGLSYFPKTWLGINLSISPLSFSTSSSEEDRYGETFETKSGGLNFGVDSSAIGLGVNFFLGKK
ncbi:hypothetical protein GCM10009119_07720 [Algoriphagus jejuensis]|uniref:Outer membrane protein beta-barrel domain-containing protein n=1 Tax=Algoriphagus jejuensis TaxID=419934 RepID=A0ABP3Y8F4_9BACT